MNSFSSFKRILEETLKQAYWTVEDQLCYFGQFELMFNHMGLIKVFFSFCLIFIAF